ncbi:hypothetical protein pv_47 [Pithovirus sibericum]|uniref:Uncharacterized protein n=1 Tax=Pithovirus sibericum TaxID=1450746 RepID=W5S4L0_9VIRU|nr:hypothetical protein pv_47 [Pithovirus sibericum]AHH01614.1 hypothetical protein pv_47 [Pithovirus sibericum]
MERYLVRRVADQQEFEVELSQPQLRAVSALFFLIRMVASAEPIQLFKISNSQPFNFDPITYSTQESNPTLIQIFPSSDPLQAFFRQYPGVTEEEFLFSVREGKSPGIQSMDLGERYRNQLTVPCALLRWGFPSAVPIPEWNGMALLIQISPPGFEALKVFCSLLGEEAENHVQILGA